MAEAKRERLKSAEVCELAQLQPYVLRSWEAEFPGLGRPASSGGGRIYEPGDVELVLRIKQLVFVEGLTLAGARRRLDEERPEPAEMPVDAPADALSDSARSALRGVRLGLEEILQLLSRDAEAPLELTLVAQPTGAGRSSKAVGGKRRRAG